MKLQKHERQAVAGILAVAKRHGVDARLIHRGRHPVKVELTAPGWREVVGMSSSPGDPVWAVRVAVRQAEQACRAKPVTGEQERST